MNNSPRRPPAWHTSEGKRRLEEQREAEERRIQNIKHKRIVREQLKEAKQKNILERKRKETLLDNTVPKTSPQSKKKKKAKKPISSKVIPSGIINIKPPTGPITPEMQKKWKELEKLKNCAVEKHNKYFGSP